MADIDAKALLAKWEGELTALDARRSELLIGISMARRELGIAEDASTSATGPHGANGGQPEREGGPRRPYLGMNILEAARLYLVSVEDPRTPMDIADAIRRGGVHSRSDDFPGVVRTTLSRSGREVGIESFGNMKWGLREWRPGRAKTDQGADEH